MAERTVGVDRPIGFLLAALSVTDFAATFVFGEGATVLPWLGMAFVVGSVVVETRGNGRIDTQEERSR